MVKKLLAIPNDKIEDYDMKGFSREDRNRYFNPNGEFDVYLLGYKDSEEKSEFAGFPVFPINEDEGKIDDVLEKVQPDLVRGYNGEWGARVSGMIGDKVNIPSFTSVHNLIPTENINYVDRVFCVSNAVKDKCLEQGADEQKLKVLRDYVDLNIFRDRRGSKEVEDLSYRFEGENRSLSVGRFVWQKNLENLLRGLNDAQKHIPLTHVHIGEKGSLENHIKSLPRSIGMENIYFLPNQSQEDLSYFYSWADVFTMASVSEGFGLVYAESLASGTPVVTSNLPPMTEYVKEGYNGFLADPNSPKSISKKVYEALSHPGVNDSLAENSKISAEKFDINKLKRQEAALYKELLR